MSGAKLHKGDPLVLLPSGEETTVHIAGKNSFTVRCHVSALLVRDEYDPKTNPAGVVDSLTNSTQPVQ